VIAWLRRLLGARTLRERRTPLADALAARAADRLIVDWARGFADHVPGAWAECPRGVWAIELALRAGVSPALLARAVERTAGEMPSGIERKGDLLVATARFERADVPADVWLTLAQAVFHDAVDATPEVQRTRDDVERFQRYGDRQAFVQASVEYDRAYAEAHLAQAEVVRRVIGAEQVEAALYGASAHPYR
jgi:hypothetical protein